jgi:hypothetical protein
MIERAAGLPQTNPGAAAVLVDELDTGNFNSSVSPWLAVGLVEQRN